MRKILIGVVVATIAVAACGGSSKNNSSAGGSGTTAADNSNTNTTVSGGTDDISKLAGQYAKAKIKITYTSTDSGESTTLTIAQDGNGKSAFSTGDGTFYSDGKSSISCQGTGASAKCFTLGAAGAGGANIGASYAATFSVFAAALSTLPGGDKSSDTIAGRDASCVKYKASDVIGRLASSPLFKDSTNAGDYNPDDTATICVDKQTGFVLKFGSTKKGTSEDLLVATEVGEPTDADFTPPVTPETVPSIPNVSIPNVSIPSNQGQ
jgi:hypothetical protein